MHQFHEFILPWESTCFEQILGPSSGYHSVYTQQWYMSYMVVDSFREGAYAPARKLSTTLYDIYHCWVYTEWYPDDGPRICSKHVDSHARINLWNWCI